MDKEARLPPLEIVVPVVMSCALLWWGSQGMNWSTRLAVAAITLVVVIGIVLAEHAGYLPDFHR